MSETPDELVHVERGDDGVAVVTLRNGKVNALSMALLQQLRAAAEDLTADPPGAVVVTGGDRIFAAGAQITEFLDDPDALPSRVADRNRLTAQGHAFLTALNAVAAIPRATIAEVGGLRPGRRLRAGPGLRLPHRVGPGQARPARDPARASSPAAGAPSAWPAWWARRGPRT